MAPSGVGGWKRNASERVREEQIDDIKYGSTKEGNGKLTLHASPNCATCTNPPSP